MISFGDLGTAGRGIFIQLLFLIVLYGLYHLAVLLYDRRWLNSLRVILIPVCVGTDGVILFLYYHIFKSEWRGSVPEEQYLRFAEIPFILVLAVSAATVLYMVFLSLDDREYRRNSISRNSVKSAVDNLPSGLCLAEKEGRPLLTNHKMNGLCERITEDALQDANLFWQAVKSEDVLSDPNYAEVQLADGCWWAFQRHLRKNGSREIIEITASDISEQKRIYAQLVRKNRRLAEQNLRLKKHGEEIARITREQERLSFKMRIHREMGQLLTATRYALSSGQEGTALMPLVKKWKLQMNALQQADEMTAPETNSVWDQLIAGADLVGLQVKLLGDPLPKERNASSLLTAAAAEAMTNAVRHAGASCMQITIHRNSYSWRAEFRNDGKSPKDEVRPGGGLCALQKKLEESGGSLEIQSRPFFQLTVTIPGREREDGENKNTDCGR